jgi:ESCRT-II complex subunit VPS22
MRRGPGISAFQRQNATASSYSTLSTTLSATQLASVQSNLESFRTALLAFAKAHHNDIKKDPAFRHQFQKMCAAIGVDPLAGSTGPSGWQEMLGLGEWQYGLAVQIVDVCVSTRAANGGLIEVGDLAKRVEAMRAGTGKVSTNDIVDALPLLKPLSAGYTVLSVAGVQYVRSVPRELDTDQSVILGYAKEMGGRVTERGLKERTGWKDVRVKQALEDCIGREGMGWVDEQSLGAQGMEVWVMVAVQWED